MVIKILIEQMGPGGLSDLLLLKTNFGACLWRASQFKLN